MKEKRQFDVQEHRRKQDRLRQQRQERLARRLAEKAAASKDQQKSDAEAMAEKRYEQWVSDPTDLK
jgi:hypothetical protein